MFSKRQSQYASISMLSQTQSTWFHFAIAADTQNANESHKYQ